MNRQQASGPLAELLATVATGEFEDDGWVHLTGARWDGDDLRLALTVRTGEHEVPDQSWEITCHSPRAQHLTLEGDGTLCLSEEHVLLWPHTQPTLQLYFRSPRTDIQSAIGALYERHAELVGHWIAFHSFFNRLMRLADLLAAPSGMLGTGPEPLMRGYGQVLQSRGFQISLVGPRPPQRVANGRWVEETSPLAVLILGESFVVAPSFSAHA